MASGNVGSSMEQLIAKYTKTAVQQATKGRTQLQKYLFIIIFVAGCASTLYKSVLVVSKKVCIFNR